jgi:hypothetical protein
MMWKLSDSALCHFFSDTQNLTPETTDRVLLKEFNELKYTIRFL